MEYGLGLSIGDGKVVPEVKYMLKPGLEKDLGLLVEEYTKVTLSVMERAVNLGITSIQLETEFVEPVVLNDGWAKKVAEEQKSVLTKYHSGHGVSTALRGTIADVRRFNEGLRSGRHFDSMMESFGQVASGGADLLSIESRGGQEVFSYSLIRNDIGGLLFALGVLSPRDVRFLWKEIVAAAGDAIPAGDTACAFANSAMVLADGLMERRVSHSLAAVIRAMSAVRTLACYESGARGPGKDCAYENVMIKAITGYPVSMEGKTAAMAHSSLVGNVAAATCDMWSNETVVFDDVFGGKTTAAITEMLSYDTALMNQSISAGTADTLQRLYVDADRFRDPQALVLCPDSAVRIAKAIVAAKTDYDRTVAAAREAVAIIEENAGSLRLPEMERRQLALLKGFFWKAPDEGAITEISVSKYASKVDDFLPKNYGL